jgi:hypothetical protein
LGRCRANLAIEETRSKARQQCFLRARRDYALSRTTTCYSLWVGARVRSSPGWRSWRAERERLRSKPTLESPVRIRSGARFVPSGTDEPIPKSLQRLFPIGRLHAPTSLGPIPTTSGSMTCRPMAGRSMTNAPLCSRTRSLDWHVAWSFRPRSRRRTICRMSRFAGCLVPPQSLTFLEPLRAFAYPSSRRICIH